MLSRAAEHIVVGVILGWRDDSRPTSSLRTMSHIAWIAGLLLTFAASTVSTVAPAATDWHLRYAELEVAIHLDRSISGDVRLLLDRSRPSPLVLDFADSMTVDSITGGGHRVGFERGPAAIRVADSTLAPACRQLARAATHCDVRVWYHGIPSRSAFGIVDRGGKLRAASYGVPRSAREWWPTLDTPSQKMDSADVRVFVPRGIVAASNGLLQAHTTLADGTEEFDWSERRPIYADVISVAAADYVERRASFRSTTGRTVPLSFFVFPEDTIKAAADFATVPNVLAFLEQQLGAYPFANEKYGIAEMMRPSFREHQTLPSLGSALITGDGSVARIIAHEAAHQWFGNSLTVSDWRDIWLNESFAEYMSWRWVRSARGDSAFDALWRGAADHDFAVPLGRADSGGFSTMFGALTFHKGPVVLLMLEDLIGTTAMDAALRSYVTRNAYRRASLAEFRQSAEKAAGRELGWFFDQWTTRSRVPEVSIAWAFEQSKNGGQIRATIAQSDSVAPFRVPLRIRVVSPSGNNRLWSVELRQSRQEFTLHVDEKPANVTLVTDRTLVRTKAAP
jgi:aminopeptidase N